MEKEEVISNQIQNIELDNEEEEPENEEENENNINLVKEERVEKDEPIQEIKLVEKNSEANENEEEDENEAKEEEVEVEEEEEKEGENQEENEQNQNNLKIKLNNEGEDEPLERENKSEDEGQELKEVSPEERRFKENEQISKNSEENAQNEDEYNRNDEEKGEILQIRVENPEEKKSTQKFNVNDTEVSATYTEDKNNMNIIFKKSSSSPNLILHWGLYDQYPINAWHHPNRESYPKNTKEFDAFALQTRFVDDGKESTIELELPKNEAKGISFVFYNPNINQWYNNNSKDFQIRFSN